MVFKKIIFQNRYVALETPSRPPPLHGKCHLKFPFWLFDSFPYFLSLLSILPSRQDLISVLRSIYDRMCLSVCWLRFILTFLSDVSSKLRAGVSWSETLKTPTNASTPNCVKARPSTLWKAGSCLVVMMIIVMVMLVIRAEVGAWIESSD